jgi:hypothetical protein
MSMTDPTAPPAAPAEPVQQQEQPPVEEPPAYVPPTGDEPWAKYLENVPEVLQPEIVGAFREMSSSADTRIAALTPYQQLAEAGVDPAAAQLAVQFAEMLYGQVDPADPVAVHASKQRRLEFFNQYKGILEEAGVLSPAEQQAVIAEQQRLAAEQQAFETPEQKEIRELRERYDILAASQGQLTQLQLQQYEAQQTQQLTEAYKADWQQAITANGQVSKKEFELISLLAQNDPDDSPGVIGRAYARMLADYGRLPDAAPAAPAVATPRPPVLQPGGAAPVEVPTAQPMRFDDPTGRGNRQRAALEAIALLGQEGAPTA